MKIALAVWNGRISPVFDVSRQVLVLEIRNEIITGNREELFANDDPLYRVCRLAELNIEILICGAISQMLAGMLTAYKIRTIPFIAGEVEEVVAAYLTDRLPNPLLSMPGCCRQCNHNYKGVQGLLKRGGRQQMAVPETFGKRESSKKRKENNMPGGNRKGPCGSGQSGQGQCGQGRGQGGQGRGQGGQGCGQGGQGCGQKRADPLQKKDTGQPPDEKNS